MDNRLQQAATLFDNSGSLTIATQKTKGNFYRYEVFRLVSDNPEDLDLFLSLFGGGIYPQGTDKIFKISGKECRDMLVRLLPYIHTRVTEVSLLLQHRSLLEADDPDPDAIQRAANRFEDASREAKRARRVSRHG